jgi:hypothetical protein
MYTGLKSYLLLAGASISAIAAVGSVFELASGAPDYGPEVTTAILILSVPLTIACFVFAVSAARAHLQK